MSEFGAFVCLMMVFAFIFAGGIHLGRNFSEPSGKAATLIKECQVELPRNQRCKLVAVIDEEIK